MSNIETLESKLHKLQKDNELLEKQMRLAEAEQRASLEKNKSTVKSNGMQMKELRMQIEELKVRLKRQEQADEKLIQDVLQQLCRDRAMFTGHTPKECFQMVESRVIDLNNKSHSLSHGLRLAKRTYTDYKSLLKEITEELRDDLPSETDCLQHIRRLENEQQKLIKNIEDCENARNKYKVMVEHLRKKQSSQYSLLLDLKTEETVHESYGQEIEERNKDTYSDLNETEIEFRELEEELIKLKDDTGTYDANEIHLRFLEQKSMHEDLMELKKKAEKRLQELKEEKRDISSKMTLVKGADTVFYKSEAETTLARDRLKEQGERQDKAKTELDSINYASNRTKDTLQKLIRRLNPKMNEEVLNNMNIVQLATKLENNVRIQFHKSGQKA